MREGDGVRAVYSELLQTSSLERLMGGLERVGGLGGERVCVTGQSRGGEGLKNNGPLLMMTNTVESSFLKCLMSSLESVQGIGRSW